MNEHYPRLRLTFDDGYLLVREGLSLSFYMRQPHAEVAPALIDALQTYLRAVGPNSIGRYADLEGDWQDLDEAGWKYVNEKLSWPSPLLTLHDAKDAQYRYRVKYFGKSLELLSREDGLNAVCAVQFCLPTEYLEEHGPERVRALTMELASRLPFSSGHAGLAYNGELDIAGMPQQVRQHCFRYPGLDILPLEHVAWEIGTKVRGPSWLTFLGQPALNGLGGVATLRSQLKTPGTTVEPLDGDRAVIALGDWPEAGDIEQGKTLPAYRELARVLEPWLFREEHPYSLGMGFTPEELLRWERRFLD
ncbi:DUF3396 domain-containing protein [Pyxidicoccus trucidator]|uniref:DUF3396 domain-containing protein n=1 Tax=Pyxidicoccus trucidator TaxID=2709662 RepID=UPI001F07C959|nr:DUF3396 domain-containing protein [Pyxidicoccus trucidator]